MSATSLAACRRAYQRGVVVPTSHVDQLWREYEQLENSGANKTLARRILDEWRPKYQAGTWGASCVQAGCCAAVLMLGLVLGAAVTLGPSLLPSTLISTPVLSAASLRLHSKGTV